MEWFTAAQKFNQALSSANPTPGGGAAAAMAAAMGCSLAMMAVQTTANRKTTSEADKKILTAAMNKLGGLKAQLSHLISEDSIAYTSYLTAKKLPKEDSNRAKALEQALLYAARIPADTATTALLCLREIEPLREKIATVILSDIFCARHLLKCAVHCCMENIWTNMTFIENQTWTEKLEQQVSNFSRELARYE